MITLYTARTPNGIKASICLEELELPYDVRALRLDHGEQKGADYLQINPNGRIPAIVDHDADDLPVFESGAILVYLAEKTGRLMPTEPRGKSRVMQWLMFQMGGLGPMQGQANVFFRYAPEKLPYAIDRYQRETRRLYEVLDRRLGQSEYLADDYSIADIANWSWVRSYAWAGLEIDGLDNLARWLEVVGARPAVRRGADVPPKEAPTADRDETEQIEAVARKILV